MPPHSRAVVLPAMPRVHLPSGVPFVFTQRKAWARGLPVSAVGWMPAPRSGGLPHTCGSPEYLPAGGVQSPAPLRLVSTTKCAVGVTLAVGSDAYWALTLAT